MTASQSRDRTAHATVEHVSNKKGRKQREVQNPLVVDEGEFTDAIRKMVNTPPVTLKEVVRERRKNPETDLRRLPLFPPKD